MNLLAIDTSSRVAAIGLEVGGDRRLLFQSADGPARRHGRDLLPAIRSLLDSAGIRARDLDAVAVGLGPGSYTGLRIGLTAARALAYAAGAEIIGLDSLEVWARAATEMATRLHVVADAQRGDVYAGEWERAGPGSPLRRVFGSRLESLADWSARVREGGLVVGPALESPAIRKSIPEGPTILEFGLDEAQARAASLLELAREARREGRRDDLWSIEPNYLRRSAAEDQQDARAVDTTALPAAAIERIASHDPEG
ncbi:tRNA (adenosine(37)-N6)-threonylcarbamoyltransferase complex dimerization subunit type 1 TsaB [Aquisphaera insulae]|uniref:tRNA (adenosine(37)-N6)-threonylcarbamoyltransferase complex dimerization subunit type 1 TsaB n=1 Tax=Aquisphaera insulae TaxID=2712864 RepID=UPI0013E9BA9F|nr:tRNA (adenosine(37)-N6)-threonylcarbamoyltransferase complex dimerization subunit type 1 TsaB [Aquisphaera insulae]